MGDISKLNLADGIVSVLYVCECTIYSKTSNDSSRLARRMGFIVVITTCAHVKHV